MNVLRDFSVAIIDDHPIFCKGVASLLREDAGCASVHHGSCLEDAVFVARNRKPKIMIVDLDMPGGGLNALQWITINAPSISCIILTASDDPDKAVEALNLGARGYILKGIGTMDLIEALDVVASGGSYVSPAFAASLVKAVQKSSPSPTERSEKLSARELQVLEHLESGMKNREIADKLELTEKTVKFYMSNIMQKLGAQNRVAAVLAFQRLKALKSGA